MNPDATQNDVAAIVANRYEASNWILLRLKQKTCSNAKAHEKTGVGL